MRRLLVRTSSVVALGLSSLAVAACGSSSPAGLLSAGQNAVLQAQLDKVSRAISNGKCAEARAAASTFESDVANLPSSVNRTLSQNLIQGATTIAELTPSTCAQAGNTGTVSTQTTNTATTTTTTATTTTAPPANTGTPTTTPPPSTTTTTSPANSGTGTGTTPNQSGGGGVAPGQTTTTTNGSGGAGVGGGGSAG